MRTGLLTLALLWTATVVHAGEPSSLSPRAMTSWQIVCDPAATPCERYAAGEFQTLFRAMTGVELPLAEKATSGTGAVLIGPDAVAKAGQKPAPAELGEEGLRIQVSGKSVAIDGGRPRGTLYGVYEFFEECCGARYLTFDHTYFPEDAASTAIPLGTRTFVPTFAFRWSYYGETLRNPEFASRLRTNTVSDDPKLGGRTGYRLVSHNVAYLVPPAKYGATHPEYYALVDGQRKLEMGGGGPQLCMTNPDVLEVVVQAVLEEIEKNPTAKNINIAQMDHESYCTCDACAAIDAREESHAGATLAFVNAVAERIEKTHPDVLLSTYAYQYTRKPPKTLCARHNVLIQLCSIECCDFHAIDDPSCPLNREFCDDMAIWKTKADTLLIWHYNTNFHGYMLPFPNLRSIGKSVAYFHENNGRGVFMQAAGNGFSTELSDLRNYVMSRCLWKPGRDSWKETEEFCRLHYREAARPILDYLTWYHDQIGASGVHPTCFPTESSLGMNQETAERILGDFRKAMSLAKSDEVRTRVEKASLCAYRAALSGSTIRMQYADGVCRPDLTGLEPGLLDRYIALCAKYGATQEHELMTTEAYLSGLRQFFKGLKAVRLENDTWRVVFLPESNGKVIEMTFKPTGRNVVEPARAFNRFRYEEWVRQGEGPMALNILPFDVEAQADRATLTLTTADGSRLQRQIVLAGDAVRFETSLTAGAPRSFDLYVHPEYDTGTLADDPTIVGIYVKHPEWTCVNHGWDDAHATPGKIAPIKEAAAGGAYAYYNRQARFGVEQRFDPQEFTSLGYYWNPSRRQINLELFPRVVTLEKGQQAKYSYEVRYLAEPPVDDAKR
jgi:hypothetical protein